jgi:hypothetical protein
MLYKYIYTHTCIDHRQSNCRFGVQILGTFSDIGDPMFLPVPSSSFQFLPVPSTVSLPTWPRIQLRLRTQNTVNTGGELRILAPLEFGFDPDPDAPLIQGDKQTRCLINEYESLGLLWFGYDLDMSCHSPEKSKTCWSLIQPLGTHVRFSRINMRRCVQMSCGTGWIPVLNLHLVLELRYILVG